MNSATTSASLPLPWRQGEHLTLVGQTGTGKSTLAARLLQARKHLVVFKSKPDKVKYPVQQMVRKASAMDNQRLFSMELRPKYEDQLREFALALDRAWRQGGWCMYLDELFYLDRLGLRPLIERLLTQGRSKGITVASGLQRPVSVTRFAVGESRHVLSFGLEGRDARELGEATTDRMRLVVQELDEYEFAWFCRPGRIWRGRLNLTTGELHGEFVS